MMSSSSDPSPWSLSGDESLAAYVTLQHTALAIVEDTTLPDDVLLERATYHLQVFERPEYATHSREKWMKNVSSLSRNPGRAEDFTARRFFDAMIQTADELNLRTGRRFPAAEVCACALLLEPRESGSRRPSDPLKAPRRLAEELSILIFDIWWTALWWPRKLKHILSRPASTALTLSRSRRPGHLDPVTYRTLQQGRGTRGRLVLFSRRWHTRLVNTECPGTGPRQLHMLRDRCRVQEARTPRTARCRARIGPRRHLPPRCRPNLHPSNH